MTKCLLNKDATRRDRKCRGCGWEAEEDKRRREQIAKAGLKRDGHSGLYYLPIRKGEADE